MALAYLCSRLRRMDPWLRLADNPVRQFVANVVDHRLRPESTSEALAVTRVLRMQLDLPTEIHTVRWDRELGPGADTSPEALSRLPNVESLARRMRYRLLGRFCGQADITSILLAHHEDDQYETVLMRLMAGHGARGLRGIRPAADIPECADMHGVYQSGFLDDLKRLNPMYSVGITRRERKYLKRALRTEMDPAVTAQEMRDGLYDYVAGRHPYLYGYRDSGRRTAAPPLEPMDIEDGGVQIYRPLLGFSKERLIATCLHNGIPWFEDATNTDPTLTVRNAVRCLVKEHELPVALQKPAVLKLAERCRERVAAEDAQAERLLARVTMHDLEPNVGSLVVQLPELSMPGVPRRSSALRRAKKREQYARGAGVLVQKLLALVTPEPHLTPLKDLSCVTARLFPFLSSHTKLDDPKAFTICGVHFVPLPGQPHGWYLSRAPHASLQPRPVMQIRKQVYTRRWRTTPHKWVFSRWSNWALYDNRFWVSLRCRVPFDVVVAPFEAQYAKAFRETMGPRGKEMLDAALRKHAPGKVRYTLPAIYVRGDIGALIGGDDDWKIHDVILQGRDVDTEYENSVELGDGHRVWTDRRKVTRCRPPFLRRHAWTRDEVKQILDEKVRLVALPTLGIGIPGIESWVEWRFRYRKVELETLALASGPRYLRRQRSRKKLRELRMKMQGKTRLGRVRRK